MDVCVIATTAVDAWMLQLWMSVYVTMVTAAVGVCVCYYGYSSCGCLYMLLWLGSCGCVYENLWVYVSRDLCMLQEVQYRK